MKLYLLLFSLYLSFDAKCQPARYEISTNGFDSIKIGMSINDVKKIVSAKLQPYIPSDSKIKNQDSALTNWGCKNCTATYLCQYKTINLLLTFFRFTLYKQTDFELAAVTPFPPSPLIQTKTGIAIGISENKFLSNCKNNQYNYNEMGIDENNKAYLFSDNKNRDSSKALMARFSGGRLVSLIAINMIGD